ELGEPTHLIANEFCAAPAHRLDVLDPSTQEVLTQIPEATPAEVDAAVAAAKKAQATWRQLAPRKRARAMNKLAEALKQRLFDVFQAWCFL
ncbi:MAG TPA: aldehyde dehydrogenase family protein, partial [Myxococcales bacterium]|nr:aldehyde dehydrogenase family protein [Myxococcales bacterium]